MKGILKFQLLLIGVIAVVFMVNTTETVAIQEAKPEVFEVMSPQKINVILERVYLDGEKSEERVQETILSMEDFWAFYQDWDLIDQNKNEMIFRKEVKDISPLLKINGYFGITDDGVLSIYEGTPNQEKVIQSFFRLDTSKLKSKQHSDLEKGIPVQNLKNYEEVLQVLGQYKAAQL
ncbi:intercompartmental signaling factor BofC [Bacillus suaedae]|uniref:Intercompartmental signaling factor BofC n=1 Tax=Halalkalibacter suaedae TaxID=2822140 RepID=A0A941AP37_9BACI|nr:intercompartmental signaling factor BofC [Bacillus suaedae]MBP3951416.1 intercompartmental signaling factor BofC [Bacillus suaedae]